MIIRSIRLWFLRCTSRQRPRRRGLVCQYGLGEEPLGRVAHFAAAILENRKGLLGWQIQEGKPSPDNRALLVICSLSDLSLRRAEWHPRGEVQANAELWPMTLSNSTYHYCRSISLYPTRLLPQRTLLPCHSLFLMALTWL